ncbi:MAG: membrane dipeptidase [Pyrinomonadaceae bacterium]|nr:membrane dipeptidase [Pyrinomonadaceae bacterium]
MKITSTLFMLAVVLLSPIALSGQKPASKDTHNKEIERRAGELHRKALVIDTHMDTLQRVLVRGVDLGQRSTDGQADLPRFKEGGVDAQFFALWPDPIYAPHHAARRTLQLIDAMYNVLGKYPDRVELARNAADVERLVALGKLAALMGIEGGHAIQNDLALLRMFHHLGVTYMTLTHANTNDWADSSTDTPRWGGLNDFGREVVREMNRIGMIVDVSHVSEETVKDVLEATTKPVIASHSSCLALSDHPRNLSDDALRAIARNGGVVGINFYSEFLDQTYHNLMKVMRKDVLSEINKPQQVTPEKLDELAARRLSLLGDPGIPHPPFERILDHIDHAVKVAGIDHVGIGSDLDVIPTPEGMKDVTDLPKITRGLLERGYKEEEIRKILGGNFLRVLKQVTGR